MVADVPQDSARRKQQQRLVGTLPATVCSPSIVSHQLNVHAYLQVGDLLAETIGAMDGTTLAEADEAQRYDQCCVIYSMLSIRITLQFATCFANSTDFRQLADHAPAPARDTPSDPPAPPHGC